MLSSENIVVALLIIFVLFGIGNFIAAPIIVRRVYRSLGFFDSGKSMLDSPPESVLLKPLGTSQLYQGEIRGYQVEHCKAYPLTRRKFTLSKVMRRHNQTRWSITRVRGHAIPSFYLLPLSEPATVFIMMNDRGVDLEYDAELANRYYLHTEHTQQVKKLLSSGLKTFLLEKELISVECIDDTVLIKRLWPVGKTKSRLQDEINCAVDIVERYRSAAR